MKINKFIIIIITTTKKEIIIILFYFKIETVLYILSFFSKTLNYDYDYIRDNK
jgi:hypothetical protein